MVVKARDWADDKAFTEQVLRRLEIVEKKRRRRERLRYLLPLMAIVLIVTTWLAALLVGASAVRLLIEATAWLRVVARIEEHLSGALLGPFAPLPSIVSLLLFVAAIVWVRMHQSGPKEWGS